MTRPTHVLQTLQIIPKNYCTVIVNNYCSQYRKFSISLKPPLIESPAKSTRRFLHHFYFEPQILLLSCPICNHPFTGPNDWAFTSYHLELPVTCLSLIKYLVLSHCTALLYWSQWLDANTKNLQSVHQWVYIRTAKLIGSSQGVIWCKCVGKIHYIVCHHSALVNFRQWYSGSVYYLDLLIKCHTSTSSFKPFTILVHWIQ